MKATAIDDVLTAVVAAIDAAVTYPVFDGQPSKRPGRDVDRWLVIGAEDPEDTGEPTESADMSAQIVGLGQVARKEELRIFCVSVGKSDTIASARHNAAAVIEDVSQHLPKSPSGQSYGAHVEAVSGVRSHNVSGGAVVQIRFNISANARLT